MKKLKCKICPSTEGLHEMNHPAGWTYILCEKHAQPKDERQEYIDKVDKVLSGISYPDKAVVEIYCTCVTAPNPSECPVHGKYI